MRRISDLLLLATIATLNSLAVQAQSCWTDISSWTVGIGFSGTGGGSCLPPSGAKCTVSESASGSNLKMSIKLLSCSEVGWSGLSNTNVTGQVDDTATFPGPCPLTEHFSGMKSASIEYALAVQVPASYSFGALAFGSGTDTETDCTGSSQFFNMVDAGTDTLPSFSLPNSVDQLSQTSHPFTAPDFLMASTNWSLSFTATPNYNPDDDCKQDSSSGDPVSSSVGCQTQSLGEDVPIAGTGFKLHYEGSRASGAAANAIANADTKMIGGWTLSVHHAYDPGTNTLFLGDGTQRNGHQLGSPVSFGGNTLLSSKDGSAIYVFSPSGQHLQTLRPMSGVLLYQFGYDSKGNLVAVKDASGNVTTIQRNTTGQPTAIVAPFGQTTTLAVDSNGFLRQVTDPLGKSETFVNSSQGLLMSRTDRNGNSFSYSYDDNGRLSKDADPLGGFTQLTRTNATSGFGWTVAETTSMGRTSSYKSTFTIPWVQNSATATYSEQKTNIWPDGLQATSSKSLKNGLITESVTLPDGTSDASTSSPDPVWGLQAPVVSAESMALGNLTMKITGGRTTKLGTAGNPFTVATETDTRNINGRIYTSTFTGSNRTWVDTSPVGRTLTVGLDSLERIASTQIGGLTATSFKYDTRGRLASTTQGTHTTTFSYDLEGFLASVTNPLNLTTSFSYDSDGHLLSSTFPDGRMITYTYDANGNLTSVVPPGKSSHDFSHNAVDLPTSYTPPSVTGTGPTTYGYNLDRDLTTITRPDNEIITYDYDVAGRLSSILTPTGTTAITYNSTTGNVATESRGGEHIGYSYNGPLPTQTTWSGTVAGTVSRNYDDNFWVTSFGVGGGSNIVIQHDNDGLVIAAGSMALARNSKNGSITGTTLGLTSDSFNYDSFGELSGYTASVKGAAVYKVIFTRDDVGRIASKTEVINGATNTYSYTYDRAGRLSAATKNGVMDTYTYDTNSNRLTETTSSGTSTGTYDAQDRLLTYGNASYTYTANGELVSQTVKTQKTTYQYDALGNLIAVTLPSGTKITYIIDGDNRRLGKEVNGILQSGFLYDGNRIVAQLNGSNQVVSQFVYATGSTSPDYMINGGVTYRIFSNQLGSPVLVLNTSTGVVAEQITYDEFGNVLSDTHPGFQPFGFAGGLYDQDTKLVRFGARDYNPVVGRWTAKDPIVFAGGDSNLYGYVLNDPINAIDPVGLSDIIITINRSGSTAESTSGTYNVMVDPATGTLQDNQNGYTLEPPPTSVDGGTPVAIPPGHYTAHWRTDSGPGLDHQAIELDGVPGHQWIQVHPGNYPKDTKGCILPGKTKGKDSVNQSKDATREINTLVQQTTAQDADAGHSTHIHIIVR